MSDVSQFGALIRGIPTIYEKEMNKLVITLYSNKLIHTTQFIQEYLHHQSLSWYHPIELLRVFVYI